jgi:flagellar basal body rod protein FlgC
MNIPAFSSAAWGMANASQRFDTAAVNVANGSLSQSPTDMTSDLVDATMLAPAAYTANATVLKVAAETQRSLLDIRA